MRERAGIETGRTVVISGVATWKLTPRPGNERSLLLRWARGFDINMVSAVISKSNVC